MDQQLRPFVRKPREVVEQAPSVAVIEQLGIEPLAVARWSMDQSSVTFVQLTSTFNLVATCGPGHPGSRSFYAAHAPGTCAEPDSAIFWDISRLTSTDLSVVSTVLGIGKANRHNIARVHMYYRSPMVGMAVTMANVALGGLIQLYREDEPFHAALREAALARCRERSEPS